MIIEFFKVSTILIFVAGLLICLGVGIIKLIDYLEENPYGSKDLIQKVVYTSIALHILFLVMGMPILQIIFSLTVQYSFNCMFDTYPFIKPEDPKFIYGVVGSLINYFLMIRFISLSSSKVMMIIPYFLIIWASPVCFFFSMSATEDTLFVKKGGKKNKTYAGLFIEWIFSLGNKVKEIKN